MKYGVPGARRGKEHRLTRCLGVGWGAADLAGPRADGKTWGRRGRAMVVASGLLSSSACPWRACVCAGGGGRWAAEMVRVKSRDAADGQSPALA